MPRSVRPTGMPVSSTNSLSSAPAPAWVPPPPASLSGFLLARIAATIGSSSVRGGVAGGGGVAVSHEAAALLVARQDGAQPVLDLGERLVDGHGGAAGIGEDDHHAVADERFDENIGAGNRGGGGMRLTHDSAHSM